jgi:hypothetical protein
MTTFIVWFLALAALVHIIIWFLRGGWKPVTYELLDCCGVLLCGVDLAVGYCVPFFCIIFFFKTKQHIYLLVTIIAVALHIVGHTAAKRLYRARWFITFMSIISPQQD